MSKEVSTIYKPYIHLTAAPLRLIVDMLNKFYLYMYNTYSIAIDYTKSALFYKLYFVFINEWKYVFGYGILN